jgi:peroxin-2
MAVVVRIRAAGGDQGRAVTSPPAELPLDDAQAERAARGFGRDSEQARVAVVRAAAQRRTAAAPSATSSSVIGRATATVPRVFQLDGEKVEAEISKLLQGQITSGVELLDGVSRVAYQWADEVRLLLGAVVFRLGVWESSQTFGDRMMNTVYRDERAAARLGRAESPLAVASTAPSRTLKLLHLVLSLLLPYVFRQVEQYVLERDWAAWRGGGSGGNDVRGGADEDGDAEGDSSGATHRILTALVPPGAHRQVFAKSVKYATAAMGVAELLNYLAFLTTGKFRTVADRILGLRLVHGRQRMVRQVSLYYMNQAIFWQVVLGFASVLLPLLRLGRVWSAVSGFREHLTASSSSPGSSSSDAAASREHCAFCGIARSNLAQVRQLRPCGHLACYYCHAARAQARDSVTCPLCSRAVTSAVVPREPPRAATA